MSQSLEKARIGIFWLAGSRLIMKTVGLTDAPQTDGLYDTDENHYSYWERLQKSKPEIQRYSYDYFARGRIVYDGNKKRFLLMGDRCLISRERVIRKLLDSLNIAPDCCDIRSDFHYQCYRCNPNYLSDF